jgi:MFS family permease
MIRQHHPLVQSLLDLRGNPRACVYTEPLWGIPYNLYAPFATLYMYRLGVRDQQIGLVLTISMVFQIVAALLGTVLVDKMGRRMSTFVIDLAGWSIPAVIWMFSQNFWWFVAAAAFNSLFQVTTVSWNCLMVEDAEPSKLVDMYTWCTISGLLAIFFAPLAGILVRTLSLVTAMRILYGITFVLMTAKFVILYFWSHETKQGLVRMQETRNVPYFQMLRQYRGVIRQILRTPATLQILLIIVLLNITGVVGGSFVSLFATQNAGVPEWVIAYFPMARAAIMLVFIFGLQHRMARFPIKGPMIVGLALYVTSIIFLLLSPSIGLGMLAGYILLDAFAFALVWPRRDSLLVLFVDPQERARILGLMFVLMIGISSPFGWIAGRLSEIHRALPFLLNVVLYIACAIVLLRSKTMVGDGETEKYVEE